MRMLFTLPFIALSLCAQEYRANLLGIVTDSTGAAVDDHWRLAGDPREVETFDSVGGARLSSEVHHYDTVTVATGAFLGAGAVLAPGVTIGANAVVGAGAVVVRDVPPGAVVVGNPAKVLRQSDVGYGGVAVPVDPVAPG